MWPANTSVFLVPLGIIRDSFIQLKFNEALSSECSISPIEHETVQRVCNPKTWNDLWVLMEPRDFGWHGRPSLNWKWARWKIANAMSWGYCMQVAAVLQWEKEWCCGIPAAVPLWRWAKLNGQCFIVFIWVTHYL